MTIARETWVAQTRVRIRVSSSHQADPARAVLAARMQDNMLVVSRVPVRPVAKKEPETCKTTRTISALDRSELRIGAAVRIAN